MQTAMEVHDRTQTSALSLDEIAHRIKLAIRDGRVTDDMRGVMLGFLGALKRPKGPSRKQTSLAYALVDDIRRHSMADDGSLIDFNETREMRG